MTLCAGCSATLRMLPRPVVAIHLYSWHVGCGYITWSPKTNVLVLHHFCPTQLIHTILWHTHTHFPTPFTPTPCPTPLFHPQHFHAYDSFTHTHTHTHTPLLHTTPLHPLHTLLSPTTLLHGTLSHTSLRHAFLAHTDPPPSLFSSCLSHPIFTCLWLLSVIRSFNFRFFFQFAWGMFM